MYWNWNVSLNEFLTLDNELSETIEAIQSITWYYTELGLNNEIVNNQYAFIVSEKIDH